MDATLGRASALELLAAGVPSDAVRAEVVRVAVRAQASARGLEVGPSLRLFAAAPAPRPTGPAAEALGLAFRAAPPDAVGQLYESLLDVDLTGQAPSRKQSGSFYTPARVAERVVESALLLLAGREQLRVCDPALGGGAFLLAFARVFEQRTGLSKRAIVSGLHGVDVSALAVAVAESALWLWLEDPAFDPACLRRQLLVVDALERGWERELGELDLVLGNPPWIAYAGRAAQPLAPAQRQRWAREYASFHGYRTLHGLFVERAAELAPNGVVALVLPSPLADLAGYAPIRRVLARSHATREPMLELGQDAFARVTQPCFALIATPGADPRGGEREWRLLERQRAAGAAREVAVPEALERLAAAPSFPRELFGEMGFQSAGQVSKTLFSRESPPSERHTVPLLEGREIQEFREGPPRLFLEPDPEVMARSRCRLRPREHYQRVRFVVRQTAKYPIAALHSGLPFRNTLLAGFGADELSPELVVALLNSSLYRALHLARRRDARQAAFPQVKVAHLRALPRPPDDPPRTAGLERITRAASAEGVTPALRAELDRAVYELFRLTPAETREIAAFLAARAPELSAGSSTLRSRGGRGSCKSSDWGL